MAMIRFTSRLSIAVAIALALPCEPAAADWPTYRGDNHRSGATNEPLAVPLSETWVRKPLHGPAPAWPPPAPDDMFHKIPKLYPTMTYDWAFHAAVAGTALYYGSSSDDSVYCVDAATGKTRWTFITEGPVRLAPTVANGRVYAGSDDGWLYCLDAADGRLIWQHRAGEERRLPGNERMISLWAVRCAPTVEGGVVYFAAGVFRSRQVHLCAVNAVTGDKLWMRDIDVTAQGHPVLGPDRIYLPTGRTGPRVVRRDNGADLGNPKGGGCNSTLLGNLYIHNGGECGDRFHVSPADSDKRQFLLRGLQLVADDSRAYVLEEKTLKAYDRKSLALATEAKQELSLKILWQVPCSSPCALIRAGQTLVAGGENQVTAYSTADGKQLWTAAVTGKAYGLAVSGGRLFVSTDRGTIHCFAPGDAQKAAVVEETADAAGAYPKDDLTDRYVAAAQEALKALGTRKGYCLVLDAGTGRLAYEIARQSEMQVVAVEEDQPTARAARQALRRAGVYGSRVSVHRLAPGEMHYPSYFANLIVSDGAVRAGKAPQTPAAEVFRMLRPFGGVVAIAGADAAALQAWAADKLPGWTVTTSGGLATGTARRGPLAGAGQWTHTFADAGNSYCSGDTLIQGPMDLQWFGRPGPERMIERHRRTVAPLCKDGRIFIPGEECLFAVDAYNGTMLWQAQLPQSSRLRVAFDSGSMVLDDRILHWAAQDKCHRFDVQTGQARPAFAVPQLMTDLPHHWGWIAADQDLLLGSAIRPGVAYESSFTPPAVPPTAPVRPVVRDRRIHLVISDYLFAMDRATGKVLWSYRSGQILNPTLAAGGGRVYFVECHSPKTSTQPAGRAPVEELFAGSTFLVAMDQRTGQPAYRLPIDERVAKFRETACINYANGVVLLSGAAPDKVNYRYYYHAFDAATGKALWQADHDSELKVGSGHGAPNRWPVVMGDTLHAWPYIYDLKTGRKVEGYKFSRLGHGCGTVSASAKALFWRGSIPMMHDLLTSQAKPAPLTTETRPGCWVNIVPAAGLVLIPEASSGCTCPYSLQTSLALIPRDQPQ